MTQSSQILQEYITSITTLSKRSIYVREKAIGQFNTFLQHSNKTLLSATFLDLTLFAEVKLENEDESKRVKRITFKTYLKLILYFYQFATDEEYYSAKELKRIKDFVKKFNFDPGDEKTRLSKDQTNLLLEAVNCHITLKIATYMLLNFGFRISELINLTIHDIDFQKELITVRLGKGRKTRRIPMLAYQVPSLKRIIRLRKTLVPLDSTETSFLINKITGRKTTVLWLQNYYIRLSKKLGFRVHAHRLRRTFASILYFDHKIDIYLISWLLGHSSIQTTLIYLGITEKKKQQDYLQAMEGKAIIALT